MNHQAADPQEQLRVLRISHSSLTPELRERERMLVRRHPEIALEVVPAKGFHKPAPIIPFGVRPDNFQPRPLRPPGAQPPTIGFIGRMVRAKGIFVLADALIALASERWRALFVGDGPERAALTE